MIRSRRGRASAPSAGAALMLALTSRLVLAQPEPETTPPSEGPTAPAPAPSPSASPAEAPSPTAPAASAAATSKEAKAASEAKEDVPDVALTLKGYVQAGLGFRFREKAVPRDRWETAFTGQAGVVFEAKVVEDFRATVHAIFTSNALEAVTGVEALDFDGDGGIDGLDTRTQRFPASFLERATLAWRPRPEFGAEAGVMLIPFTAQLQSPSFSLMFPSRAAPNEVFVSGSDVGAVIDTDVADGILTASFGVFQGDSLGLTLEDLTPRGVVLAGRADVQPFGRFDFGEGDPFRGPFRLGAGGGVLVRPASLYEKTGYEATSMLDVRASGTIRMAYEGLYLGLEYLFRRQTDDLSSRPLVAHGAYAQASWFVRLAESVAIEPIVRAGFVVLDQSFDARTVGFTEAGVSLYPAAHAKRPDRFRITAQYLGERRFTEREDAHGGVFAGRILF